MLVKDLMPDWAIWAQLILLSGLYIWIWIIYPPNKKLEWFFSLFNLAVLISLTVFMILHGSK